MQRTYSDEIYTIAQIQAFLKPVFENYDVKKAVLFGSYAKGIADEKSDVDILVDSGLRGLHFFGLLEDVVESLNKYVDLIDVIEIRRGSDIEKDIERRGIVIYEKS
ncbi:MAG: nucleotidyltransferase domain-containing protein [Ruminococcus sp.]|nr:nucleotidyltransferase domain-containing protein [Ruminococcus sp.]